MSGNMYVDKLTTQSTSLSDVLNKRQTNWTSAKFLVHSASIGEDITEWN